ncbi:hypothetical protein Nmel_014112 [Mimus melanotis]
MARFSFLLQVRLCKLMRSKLCKHTTWVVCTLLLFSSFLPNNQGWFCSCPSASFPVLFYHLPFMKQLPLLCSRI